MFPQTLCCNPYPPPEACVASKLGLNLMEKLLMCKTHDLWGHIESAFLKNTLTLYLKSSIFND